MFQLVADFVIAALVIWGFLQAIFWVKEKVTGQPEKSCCQGKCKSEAVAPEGESENKKEGPTDAA